MSSCWTNDAGAVEQPELAKVQFVQLGLESEFDHPVGPEAVGVAPVTRVIGFRRSRHSDLVDRAPSPRIVGHLWREGV